MNRPVTAVLLLTLASVVQAQGTLSTQGLGYPPGQLSTRAASMGGSIGEADPLTPLNPASLVLLLSPVVAFQAAPEHRDLTLGTEHVSSSIARFPLFMGALLSNRSRWRNMALDIAGSFLLAFCGVSVPVSFWPAWVQAAVAVLPVSHGLHAARVLLEGGPWGEAWRALLLELLVGAGWLVLGLFTMDRLFNGGRADGSIELS